MFHIVKNVEFALLNKIIIALGQENVSEKKILDSFVYFQVHYLGI